MRSALVLVGLIVVATLTVFGQRAPGEERGSGEVTVLCSGVRVVTISDNYPTDPTVNIVASDLHQRCLEMPVPVGRRVLIINPPPVPAAIWWLQHYLLFVALPFFVGYAAVALGFRARRRR